MEAIDYANENIGAQVVEPTLQTLQSTSLRFLILFNINGPKFKNQF